VLAGAPRLGLPHALVQGFHSAFIAAVFFAAAGSLLALLTIARNVGRSDNLAEAPTEEQLEPEGIANRIAAAVESWEGATSYVHHSGDIELRAGGSKLGYLHGDAVAELLLPSAVREDAIASGLAHPHDVLPDSNWVNVHLYHADRFQEVIDLLRSSYERAMRGPAYSPATE
jgi:hypothetical protein